MPALSDLLHDDFSARHIGVQGDALARLLEVIGVGSVADLVDETVPESIREREPMALPPALSEPEALAELRAIAAENRAMTNLIGMGYSGTHTPPVIKRVTIKPSTIAHLNLAELIVLDYDASIRVFVDVL